MADEDKTIYIGLELDRQAQSAFATSVDAASSRLKAAFANVQDSIRDDTKAVDDLRAALNDAADESQKLNNNLVATPIGGDSGGLGGVSGLRRTGGALSQIGLSEVGRPVQLAGDIAQIGKELDQITGPIEKFGSSLIGLPGVAGDAAAGLISFAGPLAAAGAAAIAFAAPIALIVVALGEFKKGLEADQKALDDAIAALDKHYQAINTLTSAQAQKEINDLQKAIKERQPEIDQLNAQIKSAKDGGGGIAGAWNNLLGVLSGAIPKLQEQADKLQEQTNKDNTAIADLSNSLKDNSFAAQDAEEAQKKLTASIIAQADATKAQYLQDYNDSQLSVDAAKKKAEQIKATIDADAAEIEQLKASGNQTQEVKDKIAALTKEAFALDDELQKLNNTFIPAAQHAKELADKLSAADKAMTERADAQSKADDKRVQDMATAVAKADDDIAKITEQGLQKKIDIEKKYQDALLQAATRAAQQAADDLQKLYDQRAQNEVSFQRGEADAATKAQYDQLGAQVKYQEETAKSYQDHLARLQDIQRNAQQQNVQNILDRNFLAIFQNQLSTSAAMQNENIAFGRSERDRAQQEQAAQADNQRQIAFDHQQRLIAYERANQDARTQYEIQIRDNQIAEQRSIEQARKAKTQELNDLSAATNQALSIRRQGLIAELQLITQGETQKLAIQQQFYQRAINLLNSATRGATINMNYNVGNNAARSDILQATARQTTQIVRQVFSAGGVQLVSS